jgi:NUDIX domain.
MAKEKDRYQVSLKALLKNDRGEILALKSVDNCSFAGYYDFPGGRIDVDEFATEIDQIIAREIKEEIGDIRFELSSAPVAIGRHQIGNGTRVIYIFFEAKYLGGEIVISNEHLGYKWLELKNIDLAVYFKSGILDGVRMYQKK